MGNAASSSSSSDTVRVFKRELADLQRLVSGIVTPGLGLESSPGKFRQERHAFLVKDVCDHYAVVMSNRLNRYPKLDLQSVGTSLLLVPTARTDPAITKTDLCKRIAGHYLRILYVLSLIAYIYDLEHDGDLSIAGIVYRNVRVVDDVMEIHYCDVPQRTEPYGSRERDVVDFSRLAGLAFFVQHMLTAHDAAAFMAVFKDVLARKPADKLVATVQKQAFSDADRRALEGVFGARMRGGGAGHVALKAYVAKDGPLLADDLCYAPRRLLVQTNTREGRAVRRQYDAMRANYHNNLQGVLACVRHLVDQEQDPMEIRSVSAVELERIVSDICRHVKTFFLQSLVDYQRLLDAAKRLPSLLDRHADADATSKK